jgi:hypothetical protein
MLMDALTKWKCKKDMFGCEIDEDLFSIFYQEYSCGKSFCEMFCDLAYQIYELQVCVDGLLEDLDG